MTAVTISRQMGSLGGDIAKETAHCLGFRVVWREVINQAASRAGVPEVALATIDELGLLGLRPSAKDFQMYHAAVREIMRELAAEGQTIIVGRAGQAILHNVPGVVHVRLYAPLDLRIERIAKRHEISLDMAREQVVTSDQTRTRYLKRFYQADWNDPNWYDVMVNTARCSAAEAAAIICAAVKNCSA